MNATPHLRVVCHDIRSLHNIGAIFRTADGAGFSEVILSGISGTPPQNGIRKVALGAEDHVAWQKLDGIDEVLDLVCDDFVVVCEQNERSVTMKDLTVADAGNRTITLIMGSELDGVDARFTERADAVVEIPMRGIKESLNVSVAMALIGYQIANEVIPDTAEYMRGSVADRRVTPGVLTFGVTTGETPDGHANRVAG